MRKLSLRRGRDGGREPSHHAQKAQKKGETQGSSFMAGAFNHWKPSGARLGAVSVQGKSHIREKAAL
jgi:hypothetical protein